MKFKDEKIQGEVFILASNLMDATNAFSGSGFYDEESSADNDRSYTEKIYRVEITIYEA
jgi:hypothetical protein